MEITSIETINNEENIVIVNSNIFQEFKFLNDSITLFKMQLSTLQQQLRNLEKNVKKELKQANKTSNKNKNNIKIKKSPSGFAKPTKITKELCKFMNIPEGSQVARTEVTKALVNYIKSNNLQEQTNKSKNKIIPDENLKNLLGLNNDTQELTFFSIQKYMNKHFIFNNSEILDKQHETNEPTFG